MEIQQDYRIGEIIHEVRTSKKISQSDLCKGLCTQSHISKIEKGQIIPSADLLFQISLRLGVDINLFFQKESYKEIEYFKEFQENVRLLVQDSNFKEVKRLINKENNHPYFQTPEMKKFILWHKGLVLFYEDNNYEEAIKIINEAMNLPCDSLTCKKRNIEMIINLANFSNDSKEYTRAIEYYKLAIRELNQNEPLKDENIYIRTLFNYSHVLIRTGEYPKALHHIRLGINLNIQRNNMYHMGQLYYNLALAYNFMQNLPLCEDNIKRSKVFFDIYGLPKLKRYAESMELAIELNKKGVWEYQGLWIADMEPDQIEKVYKEFHMVAI